MKHLLKSGWRSLAPALITLGLIAFPVKSRAGVAISITIAPPALPVYTQPPCPADGYLWMPGYWAYGPEGYYWVPGTWVLPPQPGLLWTPGYWGYTGGVYAWHAGYWGTHVGYYGGVHYGFGYVGTGFQGGYWSGGRFLYNTAVTRVNTVNVHNVYNKTVIVNKTYVNNTRVSYNGRGGVTARPTSAERQFANQQRVPPSSRQVEHERYASANRAQFASQNHGRPGTYATERPVNADRGKSQNARHEAPRGGGGQEHGHR